MPQGKLIVIDGADGAGKQTQAKLLQKELLRRGFPTNYEEEPTSDGLGLQIKEDLKKRGEHLDPRTQQLLFTTDRSQHFAQSIEPALKGGTNVIMDRSFPSSIAYAIALGVDSSGVDAITLANTRAFPPPDVVLLLDISVEEAAERRRARGRPEDRHEADIAFQQKVRDAYHVLYAKFKNDGWYLVDAGRPVEAVQQEIIGIVEREIPELSARRQ
jgi:dTMP kinase